MGIQKRSYSHELLRVILRLKALHYLNRCVIVIIGTRKTTNFSDLLDFAMPSPIHIYICVN